MRVVDAMKELRKSKVKERDAIQQDIDDIDAMLAFHSGRAAATTTTTPMSIRDGSIKALFQHDGPMHRKQIYVELLEMGITITGKDPVASLGSVLSRNAKCFAPYGSGVWGLKRWQSANEHTPLQGN